MSHSTQYDGGSFISQGYSCLGDAALWLFEL